MLSTVSRVCSSRSSSFSRYLSHPKDPLPPSSRSEVIYQILCRDCDKSYVSQAGRTLLQRVKEHQWAVKTMNTDSCALVEHAWNQHHHIAWDEATVLDQHPFQYSQCVMEPWYINNIPETLNREKGLLPETYLSLPSTLQTSRSLPLITITTPTDYPDV